MCDTEIIKRLYSNVLADSTVKYNVRIPDIRTGIQNIKEVYRPNPCSLSSAVVDVANFDDAAHRCGYLHKIAPFHTALVADMLYKAILANPHLFRELLLRFGRLNLCSLGGGPGSDVIGTLSALNSVYGFFQVSATIVDCMSNWRQTFNDLIEELRYGSFGNLGECVTTQYFEWSYIEHNLLGKMTDQVCRAIATANFLTMIKFVSAAASKDTSVMLQKIFRTMKPGAVILYIDNAGGGFHQLVRQVAINCNLITVFGPLKHEHYVNHSLNIKRYGYMACTETKVTVHMWMKPYDVHSPNAINGPLTELNVNILQSGMNRNQEIRASGRVLAHRSTVDEWGNQNPPVVSSYENWQSETTYFDSSGRRVSDRASNYVVKTRRSRSRQRRRAQRQPRYIVEEEEEESDEEDSNDDDNCTCCVIS